MNSLFLTFLLLLLSPWAFADNTKVINENPLSISASIEPRQLPQGANGSLKIQLELADKHHAYLDQFKIKVLEPQGFRHGEIKIEPVVEFEDTFSKKVKKGVKGKSLLTAVIEVPESAKVGATNIKVQLRYQACTKDYCLFPKNIETVAKLKILSQSSEFSPDGPLAATVGPRTPIAGQVGYLEKLLAHGLFFAFLSIFIAGILTSFTPCIFPMIPITLAVIGAHSRNEKRQSKWKGFSLSLLYVSGIALTYSVLGLIAARSGILFGSFLSNPFVVAVIVLLFIAMGLSMMGLFEIKAPQALTNKFGRHHSKTPWIGALGAGFAAGVVASPCVGPVLVSLLAFVASTQNTFLGWSLLMTFGFGLGLIFIILGTFSQLINKIPKSGPWMEGIKAFFGAAMFALAAFYLHPIAPDWLYYGFVSLSLIVLSSFYGAFIPLKSVQPKLALRKGFLLFVFFIGAAFSIKAVVPEVFNINSQSVKSKVATNKSNQWIPYSEEMMKKAKAESKPVIIDFYADWCVACKELEKFVFQKPEFLSQASHFVLLKYDATEETEEFDRLRQKYNIFGLPMVVFHNSDGVWNQELTLTGFESLEDFLKRIQRSE